MTILAQLRDCHSCYDERSIDKKKKGWRNFGHMAMMLWWLSLRLVDVGLWIGLMTSKRGVEFYTYDAGNGCDVTTCFCCTAWALKLWGDIWIWCIFGMFQQFGVYSYDNKVGQLLWRMATCGFGMKSDTFDHLDWNSFQRPLNSQLLVYIFGLTAFLLFKEQKGQLKKITKRQLPSLGVCVCVVKGVHPRWSVSCFSCGGFEPCCECLDCFWFVCCQLDVKVPDCV